MEQPAAALRRLARGLLYERSGGEDALQEAWLAALRKDVPAERLPRWLAVAARYSASLMRREETSRHARERRAARPEALPSAAESAARVELLRRVVEAVGALAEPYKTVVLLRFFEDLPPRAIARRLGAPVDTVRTQLRRALERLRRALDGDGRGRESLPAALATLAGRAPLALVPALVTASVVAAAATALAWLALRGGVEPGAAAAQVAAQEPSAPADIASAPPTRAEPAPSPGREGLAAGWTVRGHVSRGTASPSTAGAFPGAPLRGRVRSGWASDGALLLEETFESDDAGDFAWTFEPPSEDAVIVVESLAAGHLAIAASEYLAQGDPAPDRMRVTAWPFDAELSGVVRDATSAPVPGAELALGPQQRTISDAEGRYRLPVSSQQQELELHALLANRGAAQVDLSPLLAGEARRHDVMLGPERVVSGTVRDEDGAPVEGAKVSLGYLALVGAPGASTTSDANGRYELRLAASVGSVEAWAEKAGYARAKAFRSWARNVNAPALGGNSKIDLVLSRGATVRGRVVDSSGRAVEGARVGSARTDADGAFVISGVASEKRAFEFVRSGYARQLVRVDLTPPRAVPEMLEVVLRPGSPVAGRVVDAEGRAVAWATVQAGACKTCTDVGGLFELEDVAADAPRVEASAPGLVTLQLPLAGERDELVLRLEPRAPLTGRVLDAASGAPVSSFVLRVTDPADPQNALPALPWDKGIAHASADGSWSLAGDFGAGLRARVAVEADGYAPAVVHAEAALEPSPDDCVARLVRATRVFGRVVEAATGAPVPSARVRRAGNALGASLFEGSSDVSTDEDGRFEMLGLPTGTTYLAVHSMNAASAVDGPFELGAEPVERRIELGEGASVSGQLLDASGAGRAGETVFLRGKGAFGEQHGWSTHTDSDGRFAFRALPAGDFALGHALSGEIPAPANAQPELELAELGYSRASSTTVQAEDLVERVELAADSRLERELRPRGAATLRGTIASALPLPALVPVALVRLDDSGAATPIARGALAADGAFAVQQVEAGEYEARVTLHVGAATLAGRARVTVPEEGEASVRVELALE